MLSILFWNLGKNAQTIPCLSRLVVTYTVDVVLLAECPADLTTILPGLNRAGRGLYKVPGQVLTKVTMISRLSDSTLTERFVSESRDMTIWRLSGRSVGTTLLATVHLPAKVGGVTEADQQTWALHLAAEIAEIEDEEGTQNTILVGDLNMNPFEPPMIHPAGFHGFMTRDLARQPPRRHKGRVYRRFYNPMWGLFGDRSPGPAGSYYWPSSATSNSHWNLLDQVLLRPSLMGRLLNLQILDSDGEQPLIRDGFPSKDFLSDHLPLLFQMEL